MTDFKSGNILDDEGEVEEVTALQLRLYGLAILELAPRTRLELKVVSPAGTTEVTFSKEDIANTSAWLAERISSLPTGEQIEADQLAVVGPQCWGCTARLVCPAYRAAVSDLWKRTDLSTKLPLDTAGSIVEVEPSAEQTTTLRISDLAARIVKIHRLSPTIYSPTHFDRDSVYWFFNLASCEARLLNGKWRHPRNFNDLPGATLNEGLGHFKSIGQALLTSSTALLSRGESLAHAVCNRPSRTFRRTQRSMFPDSDDNPTSLPEKASRTQVASPVGCQLCSPPRPVAFRRGSVRRATIPETTVDKDRDPSGKKATSAREGTPGITTSSVA